MSSKTTYPQSGTGSRDTHESGVLSRGAHDGKESHPNGSVSSNAEVEAYRRMIGHVVEVTSEAARGNLEARLLRCDGGPAELSLLARSVNHLLDMTDAFLREAGAALEHASQGKFFRRVLLRGTRGTFRHKSQLINEATQKMARNTASLKQVEQLVSDSAAMAQGAVREATDAVAVVKRLGEASTRIGDVAKSISQIAWQTKLLAFNAKIEAGRAGEAGRGFDVVAQEVKDLAQQTAVATDGIGKEITAMREEVARTAHAIDTISETITKMQNISATIERAVVERKKETGRGNEKPAWKETPHARA
jgi:methyl-accepting chemotaxis protein